MFRLFWFVARISLASMYDAAAKVFPRDNLFYLVPRGFACAQSVRHPLNIWARKGTGSVLLLCETPFPTKPSTGHWEVGCRDRGSLGNRARTFSSLGLTTMVRSACTRAYLRSGEKHACARPKCPDCCMH